MRDKMSLKPMVWNHIISTGKLFDSTGMLFDANHAMYPFVIVTMR